MLHAVRGWASASYGAVREVAGDPGMRRVEAAWALSVAANRALLVALLVIAFQAAGAIGVAVLGLVGMLPSVLAVPAVASLGDRYRRQRVLTLIYAIGAASIATMAVALLAFWPVVLIFLLAAVSATTNAMTRPVQAAFLPSLARDPGQLVAANVVSGIGEGIGSLIGPALGAALLVLGGPALVAATGCAGLILAVLAMVGLQVPDSQLIAEPSRMTVRSMLAGTVVGATALSRLGAPRLLIAMFSAQTFVRGMLTVLLVVVAISTPGLGEPGVGVLNAAMGAGVLMGALASFGLAGRSRLSPAFALALVGWGTPILLIGVSPAPALTVVLLIVLGFSNAVLDISGYTLLQGTVPDSVRASVLGVMEGLVGLTVAFGGLAGATLVEQLGVQPALIVTGAILPLLAVIGSRRLSRIDDELVVPRSQARLLRGVAMFAPLSLAVIERLAGALASVRFPKQTDIVREGEEGDAFFLIIDGTSDVTQAGRPLRTLGPGDSFGEIALVRGVPRTATVRTSTETELYRLACTDFLAAITGNRFSVSAAERVIDERLKGPETKPA